jgi:N-methylhydantoinase A
MLLGVDVGGTFTDAVVFDGQSVHTAKAATTPRDQSVGVLAAVDAVLERAGADAAAVESFAHGMTVGTNALLTEGGANTALVATAGFTDLLDIGRQARPELYRPCAPKPASLVSGRLPAAERTGPAGVIEALAEAEPERIAAAIRSGGAESVAICLLFSYLDPAHERTLADHLRSALPGVHVSVSSEVLPQFREYERCSTTVIDAYLAPLLASYLENLATAATERGLPAPAVMQSSGGLAPAAEARRSGAWSVLSGPAGGAVGASLVASLSGDGNAIGIDMGGTSCDVCVVDSGSVRRTDGRVIAGRPIQLPMVDVHTVGAGGGSIAWIDHGGALRIGPQSAGAEPGPACYGRGGTEATVTDANVLLGYLSPAAGLAGGIELDADAAHTAVAAVGERIGLDPLQTAEGIVRVANQEMLRALRVVSVERGVDPRRYALLPYGGAGPLHAAALAGELGMKTLLCPRASGVLCALGLVASERRRDTARTVMLSGEKLTGDRVAAEVDALRESLANGMEDARLTAAYDLRYRGQAFELTIEGEAEPSLDRLVEDFEAEHERRYGYRDEGGDVELVNVRLAVAVPGPRVEPRAADGDPGRETRRARFDGQWVETEVIRGEPSAGLEAEGPCVFELPEATLVLPEGWSAAVDAHGTIVAERGS